MCDRYADVGLPNERIPECGNRALTEDLKKATKQKKVQRLDVAPALGHDGSVLSPAEVHDKDDPGDETQRRYRYQHAYGVILLTGMSAGKLDYQRLWCEHHDDFLGQIDDVFDSIQVKTQQPEDGYWTLTSDGLVSAFRKFATLESRFPGRIRRFKFVSNTRVLATKAKTKVKRSPKHLLDAVGNTARQSELEEREAGFLAALATSCGATPELMYSVLSRLDVVTGPGLDDFEAVVSQTHVGGLTACADSPPYTLNAIRDVLIQRVFDASSNFVSDPEKHWVCANGDAIDDPRLEAKQLLPSVVEEAVSMSASPYFRFSEVALTTGQRLKDENLTTLEKKLIRGSLRQQTETMKRRTTSTERHLLELAAAKPNAIQAIRNQLEAVVQGVCDDASILTQVDGKTVGPEMMKHVLTELRKTADEVPSNVYGESYECLVGMSGLLTEECTVWWSEHFDLHEASS